jgi:hypothetical protein
VHQLAELQISEEDAMHIHLAHVPNETSIQMIMFELLHLGT